MPEKNINENYDTIPYSQIMDRCNRNYDIADYKCSLTKICCPCAVKSELELGNNFPIHNQLIESPFFQSVNLLPQGAVIPIGGLELGSEGILITILRSEKNGVVIPLRFPYHPSDNPSLFNEILGENGYFFRIEQEGLYSIRWRIGQIKLDKFGGLIYNTKNNEIVLGTVWTNSSLDIPQGSELEWSTEHVRFEPGDELELRITSQNPTFSSLHTVVFAAFLLSAETP
ncbi:MAG: hypothetical protein Hyperionvirus3_60 [Hyperionvirus sp.]|uniref:Uncharacterized protein n=1 Tax=Hyperionvirus sp. TaxID=2487770 RepID=A0A3G5A8U2_9VIRU|nr:MAG: hypothetical protein Hyperionvirus3_60 [Hyperionvirus sp.]